METVVEPYSHDRPAVSSERARTGASFDVLAQVEVPEARLQIAMIHHRGPDVSLFRRDDHYWIDMCATPRRPRAAASFVEYWGAHRQVELGSLLAFPPGQTVQIRNAGDRHVSLICQVHADALERHFPADFTWTDHRREACLNISSSRLRSSFMRLYQELKTPGLASKVFCASLFAATSIEFARFLVSVDEPDQKGGLSTWRQRLIDERVASEGPLPTALELAQMCKLSTRQLRRGFRASHGCSVSDYLAQMRIDAAKRRLFTIAPLKEIAASLGYSTQANFASAFRRATGTTPSEFRTRVEATSRLQRAFTSPSDAVVPFSVA